MKRRDFLLALGAAPLASACTNNLSMKTLAVTVNSRLGDAPGFDPDYPDRIPYASMAVRLPNIDRALVILGRAENNTLHWYSADRGALVTRHGRLVSTVGFQEDLRATQFAVPDFLEPGQKYDAGKVYRRQLDLSPGNRFGIPVVSTLVVGAQSELVVGKRRLRLRLLEERAQADLLAWKFVNRFWVDEAGFVWRSEQQTAPGMAPFVMEVMKPYAGA